MPIQRSINLRGSQIGQVFAYDVKSGESSLFKSIDTGVNYDDYEKNANFLHQ